jgi:hypothetical protein
MFAVAQIPNRSHMNPLINSTDDRSMDFLKG